MQATAPPATVSELRDKTARIYVAGHTGLAGSAIVRVLKSRGYTNLITRTHAELDLVDQRTVCDFFAEEKPEYVFLAAAKVGGILANDTYPAEFIYENLAIQTNVIHESWRNNVKRLLFLGSSCIYPRDCPQPIKEEYVGTGPLEPTNRAYAMAKMAGLEMCAAYNRQYGTHYLCAMPTNLYGRGDNYDLETSHVLPALLRKTHEAKQRGDKKLEIWGTGKPRREFLYVDDMADACVFLIERSIDITEIFPGAPLINIGTGTDVTIAELAARIMRVVGFEGILVHDLSKPDGTSQKLLDVSRMRDLGWAAKYDLDAGIVATYAAYSH